jgi:hypothetical protein
MKNYPIKGFYVAEKYGKKYLADFDPYEKDRKGEREYRLQDLEDFLDGKYKPIVAEIEV